MIRSRNRGAGPGGTSRLPPTGRLFPGLVTLWILLGASSAASQSAFLVATPSKLVFHAMVGGSDPQPQSLMLSLSNLDTTMWYAYGSLPGVSFTPTEGFTPATMVVHASLMGRPAGLYRDTVWVSWEDTLAEPLKVPVELHIAAYPFSDSDFVRLVPGLVNISSPSVETTFTLALYVDLASTLGAIAIPLRYDGYPGLRVDTSMTSPPDHVGVSLGPAGRDTAWTITTSLLDPDLKTLLLGFISFSQFLPTADTLAYVYFVLDSSDQHGRMWVDSTTIGSNQLTITDVSADEYIPTWTPAEIRIGYVIPPPSICLSPQSFYFEALAGGALPAGQRLVIRNCGESALNWSATHTEGWLDLVPASGAGDSSNVMVTVTNTGLSAGEYYDVITVSGPGADNSPQQAAVTYRLITPPPLVDSLLVTPDTVFIRGPHADTAFSVAIRVRNDRALAAMSIPVSFTGLPALRIDSSIETPEGFPGVTWGPAGQNPPWTIRTVQIDDYARALLLGLISFSALPPVDAGLLSLHFVLDTSSTGGIGVIDTTTAFSQHLLVRDQEANKIVPGWSPGYVHVGDAPPLPEICLDTDSLLFVAVQGAALPSDQEIRFHNCRPWPMSWRIRSTGSWLSLSPRSGSGEEASVLAHVNTTSLPSGVHWAIVSVEADSAVGGSRNLRARYEVSPAADRLYISPPTLTLPANMDTTFQMSVMLDLQSIIAIAIAVPLTWTGSGQEIWIDTTVMDGFGNLGVTHGPLGADPVWNVRSAHLDNDQQTIMLGYVSWGGTMLPPRHDTLATLHFRIRGRPGSGLIRLDSTTWNGVGPTITDPWAGEWNVGWEGGFVALGTTRLEDERTVATAYHLAQNYPNPFNAGTRIEFSVPAQGVTSPVVVTVHDLLGRRVRTLVEGAMPAGEHHTDWDGADNRGNALASGVYFVVLQSESTRLVKKALLLR